MMIRIPRLAFRSLLVKDCLGDQQPTIVWFPPKTNRYVQCSKFEYPMFEILFNCQSIMLSTPNLLRMAARWIRSGAPQRVVFRGISFLGALHFRFYKANSQESMCQISATVRRGPLC